MKKTLFLAAILSLSSMTSFAAYDAFRPQEIINIANTETVRSSDEGFVVDLTQFNTGVTTDNRTAIIKEGKGTFVLDQNTVMHCPLVVREGTMIIGGKGEGEENRVSVYDYPNLESAVFTVGGIDAKLVLDNATLGSEAGKKIDEDGHSYTTSYVSAICVGGRDGDGTLTLKNGSQMSNAQSLFAGTISRSGTLSGDSVNSHVCGSYVSAAEDSDLYRVKSIKEGGFSGFVNESKSVAVSLATINIESGSELKLGTGMSVGNTTFNIDNAILSTGNRVDSKGNRVENSDFTKLGFVGSGGAPETYDSKTIVNITNGGKFLDNNHGYSEAWGANVGLKIDEGGSSYNEINISGNSAWESKGYAEISWSVSGKGTNLIKISDHSHMSIGEYANLGYAGSLVHIDVKDDSYLEVQGNHLQMCQNTSIEIDKTSALRSKLLYMRSGAAVVNNGTVSGVGEEDGAVVVLNGATLENHGTLNVGLVEVEGVLSGDGVFGETKLYSAGKLIVGNSPGKQTYTGNLVAYGEVNFSVDELLYPQPATDVTAGWDTGCYSVIDMNNNQMALVGTISITLSTKAAAQAAGVESFELVFVTNIANASAYTSEVLTALDERTSVTDTEGTSLTNLGAAHFEMHGNDLVWCYTMTPEPTTATLSLLALAGLAARRRRK